MKKLPVLKSLAFFGAMILLVFACSFTLQKDDSPKANDKNIAADDYQSVIIGSQEWMTENLNVDVFRNGDPIPEAKTASEWRKAGDDRKPAWCYYDHNKSNENTYGKLYNWYAVNDQRGLAPKGWHVPSDKEWTVLTEYLGGKELCGTKMKNSSGWNDYEGKYGNGTNESGFSGFPGGLCNGDGNFYFVGNNCYWWSSSEDITGFAMFNSLSYDYGGVFRSIYGKYFGLSIRCLRD